MVKISRNIIFLVCVISCAVIAAGPMAGPKVESQAWRNKTINDPYATILVEAFVVEVKLSALYESGMSPIGGKSNSVSMENILYCLQDEHKAKIGSGAKVAIRKNETGSIELEETIYLEKEEPIRTNDKNRPVIPKSYRPYKINKVFEVSANFIDSKRISINYAFSQQEANKDSSKNQAPPSVAERVWVGKVCLEAGKAGIVGATQDDKNAVFLILCADTKEN
jgi:hypothetical protein